MRKLVLILLLFLMPVAALADESSVDIILFWGDGCPHCEKEMEFLDTLTQQYPQVKVRAFEVWKNKENGAYFKQFATKVGIEQAAVPMTIIGNSVFMGFSDNDAAAMRQAVQRELAGVVTSESDTIVLPVFGEVRPQELSLPVFTVVLGALDSVNPCALYVLLFLLGFLVHAKSRGRMLFVGCTFVFFSGAVYFVFMAAWLNIFFLAGQVDIITKVAGAVAFVIGLFNVKEFVAFGKGASLTISAEHKVSLTARMRKLLRTSSFPALLMGTVALAVLANIYELLCTAGFPMVYTRVLTLRELPVSIYYLYLLMYNVVYVIPLAVVVVAFSLTLGSWKMTQWQGRVLKLLSGVMMLLLGGVLLVSATLLNNVLVALGLLMASVLLTGLLSYIFKSRYMDING